MKRAATGTMLTVDQCALTLKALADHTRLRILESLLGEEKCVTDLVRHLHCPQPHISHHLRILRDAGLVEGIREGQQVCYHCAKGSTRARQSARTGAQLRMLRAAIPGPGVQTC